jgi:hypothetical protein
MKQKRGQKRKGRLHNQANNALGFVAAIPNYYFESLCSLSTVFETVGRFIVRVPAIRGKSLRSVFLVHAERALSFQSKGFRQQFE